MSSDGLFAIDVEAEVETLSRGQLDGPWQVPAEIVRLALARGARTVAVERSGRWLRANFDAAIASLDELQDLATAFDDRAGLRDRQDAITRIEDRGVEPLLWAVGMPGARLDLAVIGDRRACRVTARSGRVEVVDRGVSTARASSELAWTCRHFGPRRALAWLHTALRFASAAVTVSGVETARGFHGGLYRMRINDPLPGELAVTDTGDVPALWLLEHGVLSARAVVPGFPAFSAAIEMAGVTPKRVSAEQLRAAANPYLPRIIDQAARMLLRLVERLPEVDPSVRARLTVLLLRSAERGLHRDAVVAAPCVAVRDGGRRRWLTPLEVERRAGRRGGVVVSAHPAAAGKDHVGGLVIDATPEERRLLSELLGVRIEPLHPRAIDSLRERLLVVGRRLWGRVRGAVGRRSLPERSLGRSERRLLEVAAQAGAGIELSAGSGAPRLRGGRVVIGRDRPEVRAAVACVASDVRWLYPALVALADDGADVDGRVRERWLDTVAKS